MSSKTAPLGNNADVLVTNPEIFDSNSIQYADVQVNANGGKELYLKYDGKPFLFQTPRISCPFGLTFTENPEKDGKPASKNYRIAVSFRGYNDPKDKAYEKKRDFYDMLTKIDDANIKAGQTNSLPWIKLPSKTATDEVVRALYNPTIKENGNGDYPPLMNLSIQAPDGKWITEVYDKDKKRVENPEETITRGCEVKCLVQAQKITFPQGKFGVKYSILNMKVWPNKSSIRNRGCLIDDESDEEE